MIADWAPLIVLLITAALVRGFMPAWLFMWTLAFAIFMGCKWLTWRRAERHWSPNPVAAAQYLLGWVGMDAGSFLNGRSARVPPVRDWLNAAANAGCGAALLIGASGFAASSRDSLAAGWMGMAGIVLLLHFGFFALLALAWRRGGVDVQPLMNAPLLATSISDFWGRRWNAAFHSLAHDIVFRPLARRLNASAAAVGVFLVSGLIHDAVISIPARGGYGLPTAYFLLQAAAAFFERGATGRSLGLRRGWRGRLFTLAVTAVPAFWLFHPPFVRNVVLPMLRTIARAWGS